MTAPGSHGVLSGNDRERHLRQMAIQGFGEEAQERLGAATVFVAGAGGPGCRRKRRPLGARRVLPAPARLHRLKAGTGGAPCRAFPRPRGLDRVSSVFLSYMVLDSTAFLMPTGTTPSRGRIGISRRTRFRMRLSRGKRR